MDLALLNRSSNSVSILLGNGDGTFQPQKDYATGSEPIAVTAADFNGAFSPPVAFFGGISPHFAAVGAFNGDGKPDLAVANAFVDFDNVDEHITIAGNNSPSRSS